MMEDAGETPLFLHMRWKDNKKSSTVAEMTSIGNLQRWYYLVQPPANPSQHASVWVRYKKPCMHYTRLRGAWASIKALYIALSGTLLNELEKFGITLQFGLFSLQCIGQKIDWSVSVFTKQDHGQVWNSQSKINRCEVQATNETQSRHWSSLICTMNDLE